MSFFKRVQIRWIETLSEEWVIEMDIKGFFDSIDHVCREMAEGINDQQGW